jgi:hypothetical protein
MRCQTKMRLAIQQTTNETNENLYQRLSLLLSELQPSDVMMVAGRNGGMTVAAAETALVHNCYSAMTMSMTFLELKMELRRCIALELLLWWRDWRACIFLRLSTIWTMTEAFSGVPSWVIAGNTASD